MVEKNSVENLCEGCSKCCEYVALEFDEPTTKEDFDEIKWFLLHKDVIVFIDHDDSWNVQFNTSCEKLGDGGACNYYEKRPHICREYDMGSCERFGEGSSFKILWSTIEEFEKWMKENKAEFC